MSEETSPTFNQLNKQTAEGHTPTVLVERSDGSITTGLFLGSSRDGREGRYDIGVDNNGSYKPVLANELDDHRQAELAAQLAATLPARRAMGKLAAAEPTEPFFIDKVPDAIMNRPRTEIVAEDLGSVSPVENAPPMKSIDDRISELQEGLSQDDIDKIWAYARYLRDKESSQKVGDGHGSMLAGQYAGQTLRSMSPDARNLANRIADLISMK